MRVAIAVSLGLPEARQGSSVDGHCNDADLAERYNWLVGSSKSKWITNPEDLSTFSLRYLAGSWASKNDLEWCIKTCPDDKKKCVGTLVATGGSMVEYNLENAQGVSIHSGNQAFYGTNQPSMELLCRLGGVCGAQAKFSSKMCNAFGVPAMPLAQPGHCAVIYYDNSSDDWLTWNSMKPWAECRQHDDTVWPWSNLCRSPTALCTLQRCLSTGSDGLWKQKHIAKGLSKRTATYNFRELYHRSWLYSTAALFYKDQFSVEIMHFMAVITAPFNIPAWIRYRQFYDNCTKSINDDKTQDIEVLSLSNLVKTIKDKNPDWLESKVVSTLIPKWVKYAEKEDGQNLLSLNKRARFLIGEEDVRYPIASLTNNQDDETATKTDTILIEIDLPTSCFVSHIDFKFWGMAYPSVLKVLHKPVNLSNVDSVPPLATEKDFKPAPSGYNCQTSIKIGSNFAGKIYVFMARGMGDGFGLGYKLGLRMLNIFGKDNSNSMFKIQPLIWGTYSVLNNLKYFKNDVEWQNEVVHMIEKMARVF